MVSQNLLGLNPSIETSQLWLWEWSHECSKFPTNQEDMRIPDFPTFISQWTTPASQRRLSPRRHPTATVRKLSKFLKCIGLVRQISLDASFWRPETFSGFWCWSQLEILKLEPSWLALLWLEKKKKILTLLLMLQKSQGQAPGMWQKPVVHNWGYINYQPPPTGESVCRISGCQYPVPLAGTNKKQPRFRSGKPPELPTF